MSCHCREGWICEAHSDQLWPLDDCAGPGTRCDDPDCPYWRGFEPVALNTDGWDEVIASTTGARRRRRVH